MSGNGVLSPESATSYATGPVLPGEWTAVIPAAGRGSRLGYHLPKILYPLAGRTILEHLVDLLAPLCNRLIFVLAPAGENAVQLELQRIFPGRHEAGRHAIAIQAEPRGMADAVLCGLTGVDTSHTLVLWGDQAVIRRTSLETCIQLHTGSLQPDATCPTLLRANPYIHFERDEQGRLIRVLQAREGDAMPETGESDSGIFLFRTAALCECLAAAQEYPDYIGRATGECNFLPLLPWFAEAPKSILTPRIMTHQESVGINSRDDAAFLERHVFRTKAVTR